MLVFWFSLFCACALAIELLARLGWEGQPGAES